MIDYHYFLGKCRLNSIRGATWHWQKVKLCQIIHCSLWLLTFFFKQISVLWPFIEIVLLIRKMPSDQPGLWSTSGSSAYFIRYDGEIVQAQTRLTRLFARSIQFPWQFIAKYRCLENRISHFPAILSILNVPVCA